MSGVIPYLIRAYCEWIEDSNLTPYLLVNTKSKGVVVPEGYDANGKMVLNISSSATMNREFSNEVVTLKARFHGKSQKIVIPCDAVLSIYAQENGEGMLFDSKIPSQDNVDKKPNPHILD